MESPRVFTVFVGDVLEAWLHLYCFVNTANHGEDMQTVTARVPEDLLRDIRRIESEERTERAEVVRKLLAEAVRDWKLRKALEMVREGRASMRTAAKFAGVRYLELLDRVEKEAIPLDYSLSDLRADVEASEREK